MSALAQLMPPEVPPAETEADMAPAAEAEIPQHLQDALKTLVEHFGGQEKLPRKSEVIEARKQRYFWAGKQYVYWDNSTFSFATAQAGMVVSVNGNDVNMPNYMDTYNIYTPYGRSLMSPLTQSAPGVTFEPDEPENAKDIAAAREAEKLRHEIDRRNDRKRVQSEIARLFWTDGRVAAYTHTVANEQKFGRDDNGQPVEAELIEIFGTLETKCPITANTLEEMGYFAISKEIDINKAKSQYPNAKISSNQTALGESVYERQARLGVLQNSSSRTASAEAFQHLVTRQWYWFRPEAFEAAGEAERDELKQMFAKGCFVCFIGGQFCEARAESMDDALAICHPMPGDGQGRSSLGKDIVPVQECFNEFMNLRREIYDYCQPSTWVSTDTCDEQALREQISQPGTFRSGKTKPGMSMADGFFSEPPASAPPDLLQAIEDLKGPLAQFISGALPSLFGGNMSDQKTAAVYAMARDQAMGQLGIPWGSMQELYARVYQQAVALCAKRHEAADIISVAYQQGRRQKTEQVSFADLKNGNFRCFPDSDSTFPETISAKRAAYQSLMAAAATNPVLAEIMAQPDNQALGKELLGLEELVDPAEEARDKQLTEIDELLEAAPQPPAPEEVQAAMQSYAQHAEQAQLMGQPPTALGPAPTPESMTCSTVPVDPDYDYHQYEFEEVQRWMSSPERRQQEAQGNLAGVQNVRLHGLEHKQYMQPALPPMPMKAAAAPQPAPAATPAHL